MVIVPITKGAGEDTDLVNKAVDAVVEKLKKAGVRVKVRRTAFVGVEGVSVRRANNGILKISGRHV